MAAPAAHDKHAKQGQPLLFLNRGCSMAAPAAHDKHTQQGQHGCPISALPFLLLASFVLLPCDVLQLQLQLVNMKKSCNVVAAPLEASLALLLTLGVLLQKHYSCRLPCSSSCWTWCSGCGCCKCNCLSCSYIGSA